MAIALLADGQTREQKSKQPWSAIEALAQEFEAHLTGWEVARFCTHFFYLCRPDQMVMLMTGRRMQDALHQLALSAVPGESGSSDASLPSQTEISPSLSVLAPSTDPLIQIRSSGEASNAEPLTAPYLASAG